jgi:hypothetical protein
LVAPDTSNFIDKSILTSKGTLLGASAASTPYAVTPASTNGYVLSVDSAATSGLAWIAPNPGDITAVTAGDGLTGGGTSGDVTLAVSSDVLRTTGGQTITVASGTTVPLTIQNNGTGNSFVVNDVASDTTPFVIDAAGNVAIGGTSAGATYGATINTQLLVNNQGTDITPDAFWSGQITAKGVGYAGGIALDSTGLWLGHNSGSRAIIFAIDETAKMRIDLSGNVFIGSPITAGQNTGGLTIQGKDIELMTIMGAY